MRKLTAVMIDNVQLTTCLLKTVELSSFGNV